MKCTNAEWHSLNTVVALAQITAMQLDMAEHIRSEVDQARQILLNAELSDKFLSATELRMKEMEQNK